MSASGQNATTDADDELSACMARVRSIRPRKHTTLWNSIPVFRHEALWAQLPSDCATRGNDSSDRVHW